MARPETHSDDHSLIRIAADPSLVASHALVRLARCRPVALVGQERPTVGALCHHCAVDHAPPGEHLALCEYLGLLCLCVGSMRSQMGRH